MSFLDGYDGSDGGPIEVLRRALMGDNAPMLAKTQQMEAQDIGNQFRDRLPELPVDAQPAPGPAYRGVRVASADPSFAPELNSGRPPQGPDGYGLTPTADDARMSQSYMELGYPSTGVREYKGFRPVIGPGDSPLPYPGEGPGSDPARMSPLQLAIAGGNGDVAGLTTGPRPAAAPAVPPPGPGAMVDQNGSTRAVPAPSPAPARAAAVPGFPERNLSVPIGPGPQAPAPAGGLLGNMIPRDTLAAIARGLSGIQGRGPLAAFARGAGSAYTGRQDQAKTAAEDARKQSLAEREQRRKESDSASLRRYRDRSEAGAAGAAGAAGGTDDAAAIFGKGKRSVLDTLARLRSEERKMRADHRKERAADRKELESGGMTKEEFEKNEAERQSAVKSFMEGEGRFLYQQQPGGAKAAAAAPAAAPAAARAPMAIDPNKKPNAADLVVGDTLEKNGKKFRWDGKTFSLVGN